jgi:hypothetical protein
MSSSLFETEFIIANLREICVKPCKNAAELNQTIQYRKSRPSSGAAIQKEENMKRKRFI